MVFFVAFTRSKVLHQIYKVCEDLEDDDVKKFLRKVIEKMGEDGLTGWNIIFDDAPIETRIMLTRIADADGYDIFFLPSCESPLNPADVFFNEVKVKTLRHKTDFANIDKDAIWCRLENTIANISSQTLKSCILLNFSCECPECL